MVNYFPDRLIEAYKRYEQVVAQQSADMQQIMKAAWVLYEAHGRPFGDSDTAAWLWLAHESRTTSN